VIWIGINPTAASHFAEESINVKQKTAAHIKNIPLNGLSLYSTGSAINLLF
jgi:hypothetical protein